MKMHHQHLLSVLLFIAGFLYAQQGIAKKDNRIPLNFVVNSTCFYQPNDSIILDYLTLKNIVPHLISRQRQLPEIQPLFENYKKIEKLWGFYEEAKRDGQDQRNNPLIKELTYLSKYTLYLLDESLPTILKDLNNEPLRLELVKWKKRKLRNSKNNYEKDKKDLATLKKMKPTLLANPTFTNTAKLAILLDRRDTLYTGRSNGKILREFGNRQNKRVEEVDLFYTCDKKKRKSDQTPQTMMDFTSERAINIIRLDREIYRFRLKALASLPYKEQQYFKLKKEVAIANNELNRLTRKDSKRRKEEVADRYNALSEEYTQFINRFSFQEQNMLRSKEKVFSHDLIPVIEFWGCREYFPAFFER